MKRFRSVISFACACALAAPLAAQTPAGRSFTFDIEFTPAAARVAAQTGYPLQMSADYDGDPVPARARHADEMSGTILLGDMRAPLPGGPGRRTVAMTGLDQARLSWVRAAMVNLNVYYIVPDNQMSRLTVDTTIICQPPEYQTIAQATSAPQRVICRTMRETR